MLNTKKYIGTNKSNNNDAIIRHSYKAAFYQMSNQLNGAIKGNRNDDN